MTRTNDDILSRLEAVLDIYGADSSRWPEAGREELLAFARTDARGADLLAEARALDSLLAYAPSGAGSGAGTPALASRIVAAAVADGSREARVVPLNAAQARARSAGGAGGSRRVMGPAAALLAASFALGLYLGVAGLGDFALDTAFGPDATVASIDDLDYLLGPSNALSSDVEELL